MASGNRANATLWPRCAFCEAYPGRELAVRRARPAMTDGGSVSRKSTNLKWKYLLLPDAAGECRVTKHLCYDRAEYTVASAGGHRGVYCLRKKGEKF